MQGKGRRPAPYRSGIATLAWLGVGWALLTSIALADNPIIPQQGVCDPRIHIFHDRAYFFSTHDDAPGHPGFLMHDWQVFSSPDLVQWRKEFVLKPEDTFMGPTTDCWATDGAGRNGKYYFYFSKGQECLGVALSTNGPGGPYWDALGKPLLPKGLTPTAQYDPTVFIDDDAAHTPYLVWGYTVVGQQYHIARLNEDMISLAENPRPVTLINGWQNDAPFIMKHNGIYYLNSHGGVYATATNVYGPYTFRGVFSQDQTVDHAGFFNWHNQTFLTYAVPDGDTYYRKTKIVYAHFKDNGDIADDPFIEQSSLGVGQYDARWEKIQAEWFFAAADGVEKHENATGFEVRNLTSGSWLAYPNLRNLKENAVLSFCASSANPTGGSIEVHQDSVNGPVLGQCLVPYTGSWTNYQTVKCKLTNRAGTRDLCLVFKGRAGELLRLDWFMAGGFEGTAKYDAQATRPHRSALRSDSEVNKPIDVNPPDRSWQTTNSTTDAINTNKVYVSQIWDDAVLNDLRLIKIIKKYKAKATFAVDAGDLTEKRQTDAWVVGGTPFGKVSIDDIKNIYSEFEIASHGLTHKALPGLTAAEMKREVVDSKQLLESWLGHPIKGFVYPGCPYDDAAKEAVRAAGYLWARTCENAPDFYPVADPMAMRTTAAFNAPDFWEEFNRIKARGGVFIFWGHAFFRTEAEWSDIEAKIARLSQDPLVVWVNTSDLFDPSKGGCPPLDTPVSLSENHVAPEVEDQAKIAK